MSNAVEPSAPSDGATQADETPDLKTDQLQEENVQDRSAQDAESNTKPLEKGRKDAQNQASHDLALDGDSEAETLIESPEKKRNLLENGPRAHISHARAANDSPSKSEANGVDDRIRTRKRKRGEDEEQDQKTSPISSRRSSSLSSPVANMASNDSDSDTSVRRSTRKVENARVRGRDRESSKDADDANASASTQPKRRKRRPSDIVPPNSAKHRSKNQNLSIDNGNLTERRETRSATYPRRSSEDRSLSPPPGSRREHRRGVSTQLPSAASEKKKRNQPPPINTRRNRSGDRRSVSSGSFESPPPSRPRLHKLTSTEHDILSPAKTAGPRKFRDKNGRTFLARAASADDFEAAKQRLQERPEDLDVADNAGNTPLQIAALEGFVDIVKYLLEHDCEVNTRNIDKDTPLIDAVENVHVEVVRLLLEYGADPRLANAKGQEPAELVEDKRDRDSQEIRKLLNDAKKRDPKRRHSDDQYENRDESSRAASAASPRDSPPILGPRSPPAASIRRRTGRSESTRTGLLWEANTFENMTRLAEKGDRQGVANILSILEKANPETMIAAAKGGHDEILEILQAMGNPDADPDPIRGSNLKLGHNTPMLAAIGRGNVQVIKLLLAYRDSNKGFDPTRLHQGKTYYEISQERKGHDWQNEYAVLKAAYDSYPSKGRKQNSPRKSKELEKGKAHASRDSSSPVTIKQRPQTQSPALSHRSLPEQKPGNQREARRNASGSSEKAKAKSSSNATSERSTAIVSDQDQSLVTAKKTHKSRRSQSDLPPFSGIEGDNAQRRRRLVTGKEHRKGITSGAAATSDDDLDRKAVKSERMERPGLKRSRSTLTPENTQEEGSTESPKTTSKKRRTLQDNDPEESKASSNKRTTPRASSRDSLQTIEVRTSGNQNDKDTLSEALNDVGDILKKHKRKKSSQSNASSNASGEPDVMEDVSPEQASSTTIHNANAEHDDSQQDLALSTSSQIEETSQLETAAESAAALQLQQEQERAAAAEAEAEAAKKAQEEALAAEQKRIQEAEEKRKLEEAEARRRAEEAALARKKEEEERQEQARREMERRRQEELRKLEFLENERKRREALPSALCETARLLDQGDPLVKSHQWLRKFLPLYTVRTYQIDGNCGTDIRDDEWLPNFQVAGLLATKDLKLTQYTSLEKRPVTLQERDAIWRVARLVLSFEFVSTVFNTPTQLAIDREKENKPKFMAMEDLFWVKVSSSQFPLPMGD